MTGRNAKLIKPLVAATGLLPVLGAFSVVPALIDAGGTLVSLVDFFDIS